MKNLRYDNIHYRIDILVECTYNNADPRWFEPFWDFWAGNETIKNRYPYPVFDSLYDAELIADDPLDLNLTPPYRIVEVVVRNGLSTERIVRAVS